MDNKEISIISMVDLDEIRYQLQQNLTTKELVKFAISLKDNLSDEERFVKMLKNKLKVINAI